MSNDSNKGAGKKKSLHANKKLSEQRGGKEYKNSGGTKKLTETTGNTGPRERGNKK